MSQESQNAPESCSAGQQTGNTFHRRIVADLVAGGAKTRGFTPFLRTLVDEPEYIPTRYIAPDAWFVIEAEPLSLVVAVEVDDSCPTKAERLARYGDAWEALDTSDNRHDLRLVVIDRTGRWAEVDLLQSWYAYMQENRPETILSELVVRGGAFLPGWESALCSPVNFVRPDFTERMTAHLGHVDLRRGATRK